MANPKENDLPLIFPKAPLLASDRVDWKNIGFAYFRQPPCEVPERVLSQHIICMNVGSSVRLKQIVDGRSEAFCSVPGDLGIYPAHLSHQFSWNQDVEFFNLFLEPAFLARVGYEVFGKERLELVPHLSALFDPLIREIGFALKRTLEVDGKYGNLYADSMAHALVVHLLTRYSNASPQPKRCNSGLTSQQRKQVIDYINLNLERNLSLTELAAILHLSPYHFARLFKNEIGVAPHQYLIRCRIERAKHLLVSDRLPIAAVARTVGFASQGHFTYHFKRLVGTTPKVFWKSAQEH